jgi:hypothetical protein
MNQSIENNTLKDFADLGSPESIKISVHRLSKEGVIQRLKIGLYYYPEKSELLGAVPARLENIAHALANKYKVKIQPSGAYAANLLGLSEQVPARMIYLTDGESRKIIIGKRQIILKKTTPKNMSLTGKMSGLVIQALRYIGKEHIDEKKINILKRRLSEEGKKMLAKDAQYAPNWIIKIIRENLIGSANG